MRTLHTFKIHAVVLSAYDTCTSQSAGRVAGELSNDSYGLETIGFEPEDIVIDVGAHVGLVSMYLAKRWPFLQIYAFEPHPVNHANCVDNLRLNNVSNVRLFQEALTGDGRSIMLRLVGSNTGGATAVFDLPGSESAGPVKSLTLHDIFERVAAPQQRCRLLKIDCEGMEYEILPSPVLHRVDFLAAEFHEGVLFKNGEYRSVNVGAAHALGERCAGFFAPEKMRITCCRKQD
jgi:FkbM family methyltransferase